MKPSVWLLALLTGCIYSDSVRLGEHHEPRPEDWPIEVFVSEDAPVDVLELFEDPQLGGVPDDAEVIGKGEVTSDSLVRWASVLTMAAIDARELGGDGIVFGHGRPSAPFVQSRVTFLVYRYAK